jgi:predicted RNase H-like HicB family nuclease
MSNYRLPLVIEPLEEGGYLGTSSALPGLLVQADTVEEVLALAPQVARALIEAMREKGVPLPKELRLVELPFRAEVLVPA